MSKKDKIQKRTDFWERNRKTNGYLLKKKIGEVGYRVIRAVLLFGLCFLILQPLINKLSVSLMREADLYDATVINDTIGKFDVILCDVLCSGLGVIRRKPEIKYKDITEYEDITSIQYKILENSATYLNENGRILYSTCTLRKCENEDVIKRFLDKYPQYELKYQHVFMPHIDNSDGFYCALLQKSR